MRNTAYHSEILESHYHLIPGLMSVPFKVPIWFFLQTGGICQKTKKERSYNHHYEVVELLQSTHGVLYYAQEAESWVLSVGPGKREVFSRLVHCPGT